MIHFEFEDFKGYHIPKDIRKQSVTEDDIESFIDQGDKFSLWKMIPPGTHYYYYSVNGLVKID